MSYLDELYLWKPWVSRDCSCRALVSLYLQASDSNSREQTSVNTFIIIHQANHTATLHVVMINHVQRVIWWTTIRQYDHHFHHFSSISYIKSGMLHRSNLLFLDGAANLFGNNFPRNLNACIVAMHVMIIVGQCKWILRNDRSVFKVPHTFS